MCVSRVCTGVAAAGAQPGRGYAMRARRCARPPERSIIACGQERALRGVSERVGGPGGVGCGEHRRGVGGPGHRAQPFPGASPARKRGGSWHRPVRTPLELAPQTAGHGPEGLQRAKKGVPRGAQTHHHIHHLILIFLPLPGAGWPGGCPRKGGSPGLEAGRPGRNPENKRRRRRLLRGQNNLLWRLPKARPWRPPPPKARRLNPFAAAHGHGLGRQRRHGAGRALSSPPACVPLLRPAPFPTWIPGRLANSRLREALAGCGGTRERPQTGPRGHPFFPPLAAGRAPHRRAGERRAGTAGPRARRAPGKGREG